MLFFFFNDTATTEIYTLSLHDALPIYLGYCLLGQVVEAITGMSWHEAAAAILLKPLQIKPCFVGGPEPAPTVSGHSRSEEHTSELQSRQYLVCRLLLEKKKQRILESK